MPAGFGRFWSGEAISGVGDWVSLLALQTLVVLTLDGGAAETGLLSSARWLPYLALGLVIGALVDRRPRRPVMVVSDLARAILLALVPLAWFLDVLTLPLLLGLVVLFATASLINDAASQAFLPRLVPGPLLQRAHARIDGADAVAQTGGPSLGGALLQVVSPPVAVLAGTVGYLSAAVAALTMRVAEPVPTRPEQRHLRHEVSAGLAWVYRHGGLRELALWTHMWFGGQAILGALLPAYAYLSLGLSPLSFGLATAVAGVGALTGAVSSTAIGRRLGSGATIALAHALTTLAVVLILVADLVPAAAIVLFGLGQLLHGFAMGCSNSHEMSYRQTRTPDELQARTNTTMRSLNRAVVVVLAPIAGLVADQWGMLPVLAVAALLFGSASVGLWFSPVRTDGSPPITPP